MRALIPPAADRVNPLLARDDGTRRQGRPDHDAEMGVGPDTDRHILCAACRHPITSEAQRVVADGAHEHTFVNPDDVSFHIGCFREAPGVTAIGPRTTYFTWFPGRSWQLVLCAACSTHVGWRFAGPRDTFHGLIFVRLTEQEERDA